MALRDEELEALSDVGKVPDSRDVFSGAALHSFSRYVEERISVTAQIKALEEQRDKLGERIQNFLAGEGQVKVMYEGRPVQIVEGSHSKIDKVKLLEAGVSPIVIRNATVVSTYQYLRIGEPKKGRA